MSILFELFLTFANIGLFTFGGGYAMISLIENSCVEKKGWITHDEMINEKHRFTSRRGWRDHGNSPYFNEMRNCGRV